MSINNRNPASSTPSGMPYPLHRLNRPSTIAWLSSENTRRQMASALLNNRPEYRGGFGVISATQLLFAVVDPRGGIRELQPPFKSFEMHQIANKPELDECPCANYVELESMGTWADSGKPGHHPLCQFDPHAVKTFVTAAKVANERLSQGLSPQARPDEWDKIRKHYKGQ